MYFLDSQYYLWYGKDQVLGMISVFQCIEETVALGNR